MTPGVGVEMDMLKVMAVIFVTGICYSNGKKAVTLRTLQTDDPEVQQEIENKYNDLRRNVDPTARNMRKIMWDEEAAAAAASCAMKCRADECPVKQRQIGNEPSNETCNENIYRSRIPLTWSQVIDLWRESLESREKIILAISYKIGCAAVKCQQEIVYVCFSCPGVYPYPLVPYFVGPTCDYCPNDCDDRLCTIATCPYGDDYLDCDNIVHTFGCEEDWTYSSCQGFCRCPGRNI